MVGNRVRGAGRSCRTIPPRMGWRSLFPSRIASCPCAKRDADSTTQLRRVPAWKQGPDQAVGATTQLQQCRRYPLLLVAMDDLVSLLLSSQYLLGYRVAPFGVRITFRRAYQPTAAHQSCHTIDPWLQLMPRWCGRMFGLPGSHTLSLRLRHGELRNVVVDLRVASHSPAERLPFPPRCIAPPSFAHLSPCHSPPLRKRRCRLGCCSGQHMTEARHSLCHCPALAGH